jgi:SAM-dependent methyltransferase
MPAGVAPGDWTDVMGPDWLDYISRFEAMVAPVGAALLNRARFRAGERVLDIGSGMGGFSRQVAAAVGPAGLVRGVDVSPRMVAEANRLALGHGAQNIVFSVADAAVCRPQLAPFTRVCSRFGTLYFSDPLAAFRNLHSLLAPGGRADFAVWAPLGENDWAAYLMAILRRHLDLPYQAPGEPGPFSLANVDYFRELLAAAEFRNVDVQSWQGRLVLGGPGASVGEATRFALQGLFMESLLQRQDPAIRQAIVSQVSQLFALHHRPIGVTMGASVWLVSASRPY